jgi:hypothetical protein
VTRFDRLIVTANATTIATFATSNHASGYCQRTCPLGSFAGQAVALKFTGTEDSSLPTSFAGYDKAVNAS